MITTKRLASLAVSIVDKLSELGLEPSEKQEVIFLAGQMALVEGARAGREARAAAQTPLAPNPPAEDEAA